MLKTVDNNARDTVIELDGGECEVVFSAKYAAFALMNNGAADVVMSIESGKTETDDGVRIVGSGESAIISAPMLSDKLYVTGAGRVQIAALMELTNPFKPATKGGGDSGGGGESGVSKEYVDARDLATLAAAKAYADSNTAKIESISVNGTTVKPDSNKNVNIVVPVKTSELTNDSEYQTKTEVQEAISAEVGSVYTPKGTVAFADLPTLTAANVGNVYNISNAFVTTTDFVEGAGVSHGAGANVVIVEASEGVYKYDILAGTFNMSSYYTKTEIDAMTVTEQEVDAAIAAHNADETAHPLILEKISKIEDRVLAIEKSSGDDSDSAPSDVKDLRVKIGNGKLTVFWSDPGNLVIDGQILSTWKGTKLVMKAGAYPESPIDGTIIVDNQTLDMYKTNGYEINNLTNGQAYYFALFPYSTTGAVNINEANRISGTPKGFSVMTAIINLSNSNPETSVTYADDAVEMTPKDATWDEFFGHYPVLFKDGVEIGKLNPNDFSKFADGTDADITSGNAGDVMVAFPRHGIKISTSGNILTVSMTDNPNNPDFTYYAHTRGSVDKDVFYLGSYKGYVANGKLRSLSDKTPTVSKTISAFRTYAHNNGTGYEQSGFYQLTYRQVMYILKYKNLDSQIALGMGYVYGGSSTVNTGATNTKGMDYGSSDKTRQMKLFGLEDFWGNIYEHIEGFVSSSTNHILTATDNFNDNGDGYLDQGQGVTNAINGYMSKPQGTSETGFIAKEAKGSETTYWTDAIYFKNAGITNFGGYWGNDLKAGAFMLYAGNAYNLSAGYLGARLMFL